MTDFATRRKTMVFTGVFITSILIIAVAYGVVYLMLDAQKKYDQKIKDLHKIENLSLDVQYTFKLQVQEWKNILLRGDKLADFERYFVSFTHNHELTQSKTDELIESLGNKSSALVYALDFKQQHQGLMSQYQKALDTFSKNQFDAKLADTMVRGIDRIPDKLLIELSKHLKLELERLQILFDKELLDAKVQLGIAFFTIQVALCLVLVRLTGRLLTLSLTHKITGLSNRNHFIESIKDCLIANKQVTIAIIDINEFKIVNETCGNLGGDKYLKKIALLVDHLIENNGKVYSLGADLTGIIIHLPHEAAISRLHQITKAIENFKFKWDEISLSLTCSCVSYQLQTKSEESVESVLNDLYVGIQVAKTDLNNGFLDYTKKDPGIESLQKQLRMVHKITSILENKTAVLFCQQITPIQNTMETPYFEVLLRIKNNRDEYMSPGLFLQTAERFKLIKMVDQYVIKQLLDYLTENPDEHSCFSINLSGQSLSDSSFVDFFKETFGHATIDLKRLSFEITESDAITNIESAKKVVRLLQQFGCKVVLDDFGSGMSSYAYISDMKVNTIKIDGVFVKDLPNKPFNLAIIKSIVALATEMSLKTVAEFVETQSELDLIKQAGVDYGQGFYLHKPSLLFDPNPNFIATNTHDKKSQSNDMLLRPLQTCARVHD